MGAQDFINKPVHVKVQGAVSHQTGLVSEGTGEEGFAASGRAGNEDVFGSFDPGTVHQGQGVVFGQVTGGSVVKLFEGSRVPEFGQPQVELDFKVIAVEVFGISQGSDECMGIGVLMGWQLQDGFVLPGHAAEAQGVELIECGLWIHAVGC